VNAAAAFAAATFTAAAFASAGHYEFRFYASAVAEGLAAAVKTVAAAAAGASRFVKDWSHQNDVNFPVFGVGQRRRRVSVQD
jgi:hypothetical protein